MRIQDTYRHALHGTKEAPKAAVEAEGGGVAKAPDGDDVRVSVSQKAQDMAQTAAASAEKVERLRAALAGGSYSVDPRAIAQKMVGDDE